MPNQFSPKRPVLRPIGPSIAYVQSPCGNLFSLIDAEDADLAGQWCWKFNFKKATQSHYLERTVKSGEKSGYQSLTYLLMGKPPEGMQIDHANGVSLDNRRSNLRFATRSQQHQNQRVNSANTSGFKGVSWVEKLKKYHVYIKHSNKRTNLGYVSDLQVAIEMRANAEKEFFGEFARVIR